MKAAVDRSSTVQYSRVIDVGVLMIWCTTGIVVYGYILDACERGKVGSHCVVGKDEQTRLLFEQRWVSQSTQNHE